ncbi:MAG TPA: alpha/beta fold hydrolase [Candidatus Binataceae bacterium]|nr:alpha/beta fold hydrolase [Candidatus Binataceae bacterium]
MSLFNDIASYWMEGALRTFDAVGRGFGSQVEADPAPVTPYEVIYRAGVVSLRHYRPEVRKHATPVLIVYALIKRPFILDLQPDKSVVRSLLSQGFEVYLIDWLPPAEGDTWRGFDSYVNEELANAVRAVQIEEGVEQVNVLGYCFGALLSLLYTALHPENVANLLTLTIPFDMSTREISIYNVMDGMNDSTIDLITKVYGNCPAWMVNMGFTAMAPVHHAFDKYVGLYRNAERDGYADMFELFELWMQSDVPLAGRIFKELTGQIFKRNLLAKGEFKVGDRLVDLGEINCPVLNVIAEHDDVVHPSSSLGMVEKIGSADKRTLTFPTGHLGAVVSAGAMKKLWPQIGAWLAERDANGLENRN